MSSISNTRTSSSVKLEDDHEPLDPGFTTLKDLSKSRKLLVLVVLCSALFLDTFNNSSLFAAIPPIALQLDIPNSQSVWLLGAYQLTFAALLLIVGFTSFMLAFATNRITFSERTSERSIQS